MAIGVVELDSELQLVSDLDALGVRILETLGQGLGQVQIARELIAFGFLVDDIQFGPFFQLVVVRDDGP